MPGSAQALIYCIATGAVYLFVIETLSLRVEKILEKAGLWADYPQQLRPRARSFPDLNKLLLEVVFYITIPGVIYSSLFVVLPVEGVRQGVTIALWTVMIGGVPLITAIHSGAGIPPAALVYTLLAQLVKLAGALAIVAYVFSL